MRSSQTAGGTEANTQANRSKDTRTGRHVTPQGLAVFVAFWSMQYFEDKTLFLAVRGLTPPLTTHGLLHTCHTTHGTVREAASERPG
jgi:hypothetical protein